MTPAAPAAASAISKDAALTRAAYARHVRDWLRDQRQNLKAAYHQRAQPDRNLRLHAAVVEYLDARLAMSQPSIPHPAEPVSVPVTIRAVQR